MTPPAQTEPLTSQESARLKAAGDQGCLLWTLGLMGVPFLLAAIREVVRGDLRAVMIGLPTLVLGLVILVLRHKARQAQLDLAGGVKEVRWGRVESKRETGAKDPEHRYEIKVADRTYRVDVTTYTRVDVGAFVEVRVAPRSELVFSLVAKGL